MTNCQCQICAWKAPLIPVTPRPQPKPILIHTGHKDECEVCEAEHVAKGGMKTPRKYEHHEVCYICRNGGDCFEV